MPFELPSWHFGVLSFTGTGHLNPLIVLAQELAQRGNRVTFFEKPKIEDRVRQAGLEFVPVCADRSAPPTKPGSRRPGLLSDLALLHFNLKRIILDVQNYLREVPVAVSQAGIDALIVDEIALAGPTVAEQLRLPYFIISTSVPHTTGWKAFPRFSGYRYVESPLSRLHSALLEQSALRVTGPLRRALDRYRRSEGLQSVRRLQQTYRPLAQITQLPKELDLPNVSLPAYFHYAGPFVSQESRPPVDFPWHRLDGRQIIYASLGTTRNVQSGLFRMIAEACVDLNAQLIISLGARFDPAEFADFPGQPLIVGFAPQLQLLKHATLIITHGGANTVFESLLEGKPMIAIPIAYDQPAIAARLVRAGAGIALPVMRVSAARIRTAVLTVLQDPAYRNAAITIQRTLCPRGGAAQAASIIGNAMLRSGSEPHLPAGDQSRSGSDNAASMVSEHRRKLLERLNTVK